jgi:hypothetical protein
VAMVACFARPNASRTLAASSGVSCSISRHLAMSNSVPRTTDKREVAGRRRSRPGDLVCHDALDVPGDGLLRHRVGPQGWWSRCPGAGGAKQPERHLCHGGTALFVSAIPADPEQGVAVPPVGQGALMMLLTATREGQGERTGDSSFAVEGGLVLVGPGCARDQADPDCGCGRGRAISGPSSRRATTTAIASDLDLDEADVRSAVESYFMGTGLGPDTLGRAISPISSRRRSSRPWRSPSPGSPAPSCAGASTG